jgi:hypothetical protein
MARDMYAYVLWRDKPGWLFTSSTTPIKISEGNGWFDLEDELGLLERIAEMIRTRNGNEAEMMQYRLEISDPNTGERIGMITPSFSDLNAAREGQKTVVHASGMERTLANYSDEQILNELRRRLRLR